MVCFAKSFVRIRDIENVECFESRIFAGTNPTFLAEAGGRISLVILSNKDMMGSYPFEQGKTPTKRSVVGQF